MPTAIKFYADEHIARAVVRGLRKRGIDVLRAVDAGLLGATDEQHLAYALLQSRAVITQDADFLRLHAAGTHHAGIVYADQETSVGKLIQGLSLIHAVLDASEMFDQVEFI